MTRRQLLRVLSIASSVVVAGALTLTSSASASDVGSCMVSPDQSFCVRGTGGPAGPPSPTPVAAPPPRSGQPPSTPLPCGWETITAADVEGWLNSTALTNGRPPAGKSVIWQGWCFRESSTGGLYGGPFRWVDAGSVATPVAVAAGVYQQMQGRMPTPVVESNPARGVASIVGVPVFVSVGNWQPTFVVSNSLAGVLVTVRATPTLVLDSGEPGASSDTCAGPGRLFDPHGGSLEAQAALPGACTHTYRQRTGVDGRPDAWPSSVTVRWTITWSAADGSGGTFPTVDRRVGLPRAVSEVQAVVVPGG